MMTYTPKLRPSEYIRKGWCQGALAIDAQGRACFETSPDAVAWCAYGAVYATYSDNLLKREEVLGKIMLTPSNVPLGAWNDAPERTQAEVVALLESIGE